jgi:hypothetical protein
MLDALLDEEFDKNKKQASGDKGLDLDSLIEEQMQSGEKPFSWDNGGKQLTAAGLVTAGQVGGAAAGLLGGPMSWLTVPTGEMAGGAGAEYLNQKLGLTEPSNAAIAVQGIVPGVVRGIGAASKILPPSTNGAAFLNTIAPREAEARLGALGIVPRQASAAMNAAKANTTPIPTGNARGVIANSIAELNKGAGSSIYKQTTGHLQKLDDTLFKANGQLTPDQYQAELRDIRARLNANGESRPNEVEKKALLDVKSELEDALLRTPEGTKLANARHDILRESVVNDLHDLTYQNSKNMAGQGDQIQFNARPILDKLTGKGSKQNEAFRRRFEAAFGPQDQQNILKVYRKLNEFDKLAPPAGVNAGSFKVLRPLVTGAGLGSLSHFGGASPELAAGIAGAAMLAPTAANTARVLKLAMTTQAGRAELARIASDPKIKTLGDFMTRAVNFMSATEAPQTAIRDLTSSTIEPFPNER